MSLALRMAAAMAGGGGAEVGHRYWRLIATAVNYSLDKNMTAFTLALFTSTDASGTDLCLGKTAAASSYYAGGYEASKGNDNNAGTRWQSASAPASYQWWSVDMGSAVPVHSMKYASYRDGTFNYPPKGADLQFSDNNTDWTTQASVVPANNNSLQTFTNL